MNSVAQSFHCSSPKSNSNCRVICLDVKLTKWTLFIFPSLIFDVIWQTPDKETWINQALPARNGNSNAFKLNLKAGYSKTKWRESFQSRDHLDFKKANVDWGTKFWTDKFFVFIITEGNNVAEYVISQNKITSCLWFSTTRNHPSVSKFF